MKRHLTLLAISLLLFVAACDIFGSSEGETSEEDPAEERAVADDDDRGDDTERKDRAEGDEGDDEEGDTKEEFAEDLEPGEEGEYGDDFEIEDDPIGLADAIASADGEDNSGPVKVEATVRKVCKKKGCWFTIEDDGVDESVRVRMKDYGFFVPRNLDKGARAVIEGELHRRTVPEEEAQHYADDEVAGSDKEPERVEGDQERWEMKISAARMSQPS